ncbi:MAG: hypothetical protein M0036_04960 [Desulfobacteraceae bacterium]|nr:hypothetical protein [Desulfobacteraceae bacterium]
MRITAQMIMRGLLLTGRPSEAVRKNQLAAMHEAVQYTARRVKQRVPQGVMGAQGGLLGSIQPEVCQRLRGVTGIVGTPLSYGLVVEKGRTPGKGRPPAGVLLRWIEVKMGVSAEEAKAIEYPVRWKIAKKGTKGAFMFEKTLEEDWPAIQTIFDRYGVKISRELAQ